VRLVIVPRWGGAASHDFYPWLIAHATSLGWQTSVAALQPIANAPEPVPTIAGVRAELFDPASTIVLAHSVGCRAAIVAASQLAVPLQGLLCVAGWFTVDRPWPSIVPWLDASLDARPHARGFEVLVSDNDPFTADHASTQARFEVIGARPTLVPGAAHFNAAQEPAVLEALERLAAAR
jgi:predicted alpha/beta hydrolase family esterase